MKRFVRPSLQAIEAVQRAAAQPLNRDELRERLARPLSEEERTDALALIAWFRRRYPQPASRLAHARRLAASWLDPRSPLGAPRPLRLPEQPVPELPDENRRGR